MAAQAQSHGHGLPNPVSAPRHRAAAWTAIGRAKGRHRTLLIATCAALVVAAISDEAPGYDGPGPFIYPAFAVLVALGRWRFTPLFAAVMSVFFISGGLASDQFMHRLTTPARMLDFISGWVQMLSFAAAAVFAVASVIHSPRTAASRPSHS